LTTGSGLFVRHFYRIWKVDKNNDNDDGLFIFSIITIGLSLGLIMFVIKTASRLINPEYYAIQLLLGFAQ
jgi:hypothetical protein